jgi:hypothetical protein
MAPRKKAAIRRGPDGCTQDLMPIYFLAGALGAK